MRKGISAKLAAVSVLIASSVVVVGHAAADGAVKEGDAICTMATAILLLGDGSGGDVRWDMIRKVVAKNPEWKVSGEAERATVGSVAFVEWNVRFPYKGGPTVAYTVQCGHGGTCNDVAKAFAKEYPQIQPAPAVVCDTSASLDSPRPVR